MEVVMKKIIVVMALVLLPVTAYAGTITAYITGAAPGQTYTARILQLTGANAGKWYCTTTGNMQPASTCADLDVTATEETSSGAQDTQTYKVDITDTDIGIGTYRVMLYDSSDNLVGMTTYTVK